MSDFAPIPNQITNLGEVAITGQRLARIERALFGIRSSSLLVKYSDQINIDLPSGIGGVDLSTRPFYAHCDQTNILVGTNRPNIPAIYTIGTITTVDALEDSLPWATPCALAGRYLVVYRIGYAPASGLALAYVVPALEVVAEADIPTYQDEDYIRWPIAWLRVPADGAQPIVLAQIEQGYAIHIPARVI